MPEKRAPLIPPDERIFSKEAQVKAEKVLKEWFGEEGYIQFAQRRKNFWCKFKRDSEEWGSVIEVLKAVLKGGCRQCELKSFDKFSRTRKRDRYKKFIKDKARWLRKAEKASNIEGAVGLIKELEKEKVLVLCRNCEESLGME